MLLQSFKMYIFSFFVLCQLCFNILQGFTLKYHCRNVISSTILMSSSHSTLNVDLGDRSYPIYTGSYFLSNGDLLRKHVSSKKALIVSNTLVGPFYSLKVRTALESKGIEVFEVILPDGEEYKNMDELMKILDAAMDAKLDRKSTMIALGGGVIGDMCGFAASMYQRGIKFVQIPTSLMAMVDSAVGGKTAVNHPKGKNMIGAFYQPDAVIIDLETLKTLPEREFVSGLSEVIKYGLIRDEEFFCWLESNVKNILSRDPNTLVEMIERSCANKAMVVAADEKEGGVRATLNLGHTFGHAIETGLGYGAWLHGEAVATGIVMAADLSKKMDLIDNTIYDRIINLIKQFGLPISLTDNNYSINELGKEEYNRRLISLNENLFLDLMSMDKKVSDGQLSLILLEGKSVGKSIITNNFDVNSLKEVVSKYCYNN